MGSGNAPAVTTQERNQILLRKKADLELIEADMNIQAPPKFREKFTASVTKKTEEEKEYFRKINQSSVSKEKLKLIEETTRKVNNANRHGNSTPLKTLRPELKKEGLTRFEQDVGLMQLQRERRIDLQIASFANTLDPKFPIIPDNDRNPLYFVTLRR